MKSDKLLPQLGLFTTIAIVVGAVIGSGIFKKPAVMAADLGTPELLLLIWVIAGILTLFGALSNAEVAGMITETGGQYVFFDKMYGSLTSYLYGWAILAVIQTGSIASITYVFAEYTEYFFVLPRFSSEIEASFQIYMPFVGKIFPLKDFGVKSLTMFVILLLTIVNYFGIKYGGRVAEFFTTAKVLAILILVVAGFLYTGGSAGNLTYDIPDFSYGELGLIGGIIAALSAAFWAFDGWNNVTYIAGEVKNPMKNIPKALIIGTLIIIGVYMLINLAYLYVLPIDEMAKSKLVAADVADRAVGAWGGGLVAALVMVSTFGTSNGTIMVSARVYFAMAKRDMFFPVFGNVSKKYHTPANALFLQAIWSCGLVISGSFDDLTDMLIFVSWIFYALGAYGVIVLRKKMPDTPRPYKVPLYPYIPLTFVLVAGIFVVLTLYNDISNYISGKSEIINSTFGLLLVLAGLPLYYYFKYRKK
ncbi:MAG: amino acid permease [Candidatus Kapabacteria bacterium]|nr:amino acid permease [Ignavibacteriota bacterium]MCW5883598.1 amino acid permease [Candidatus Kapabacteria bacterium]